MFKPLITRVLNHLVEQNAWAKAQLAPLAGKSVIFNIPPASTTLTILENGGLAVAGDAAVAEASISMTASVALRLLAKDESANTLVLIEGDSELATSLAKVLRNLRWEYEEDLSHLIGDAPAHQLAELGRSTVDGVKKQSLNLAEMLSEYWQEEQPLIAKKRHVETFNNQVDELRDDVERFAKRLEKLASQITSETNNQEK